MATMNVSLPEQMKSWVGKQTQGGRFANSSDYVRDLIRRDQERGMVIAELQSAIAAGLKSGQTAAFDLLSAQPEIARLQNEFRPSVRIYIYGSHIVVFETVEAGIAVTCVLHQGRDILAFLGDWRGQGATARQPWSD